MTTALEIRGLSKRFGTVDVLKSIDLTLDKGGFLVLVGPSGCGKSTLLNTIAGLESVSAGEIRIDGQLVNGLHPSKRDIAMVFQSYALYPNMSVAENIAFGGMDTAKVFSMWMNSAGHRRNMLNPAYSKFGLAYVREGGGGDRRYWALVLGN